MHVTYINIATYTIFTQHSSVHTLSIELAAVAHFTTSYTATVARYKCLLPVFLQKVIQHYSMYNNN